MTGFGKTDEDKDANKFYSSNTKSIEILKDKELHTVYFRVKDEVRSLKLCVAFSPPSPAPHSSPSRYQHDGEIRDPVVQIAESPPSRSQRSHEVER